MFLILFTTFVKIVMPHTSLRANELHDRKKYIRKMSYPWLGCHLVFYWRTTESVSRSPVPDLLRNVVSWLCWHQNTLLAKVSNTSLLLKCISGDIINNNLLSNTGSSLVRILGGKSERKVMKSNSSKVPNMSVAWQWSCSRVTTHPAYFSSHSYYFFLSKKPPNSATRILIWYFIYYTTFEVCGTSDHQVYRNV